MCADRARSSVLMMKMNRDEDMSNSRIHQEQFIDFVRDAIENRNFTIPEAAERCGVSDQTLRNYLRFVSWPDARQLEILIERLHLPTRAAAQAWLFGLIERQGATYVSHFAQLDIAEQGIPTAPSKAEKSIRDNPCDEQTDAFIAEIATRIRRYRRGMTAWDTPKKSLRVNTSGPDGHWLSVPGNEPIEHLPVGMRREGLGFLSSWIRVPAGYGAFHKHVSNRFLDSGTEVFVVFKGKGHLVVESPLESKDKDGVEVFGLTPFASGHYEGCSGHLFLASGECDLVLFTVCIPVPPELAKGKPFVTNTEHGVSEGKAFKINSELPDLPDGFVEAVRAIRETPHP